MKIFGLGIFFKKISSFCLCCLVERVRGLRF